MVVRELNMICHDEIILMKIDIKPLCNCVSIEYGKISQSNSCFIYNKLSKVLSNLGMNYTKYSQFERII